MTSMYDVEPQELIEQTAVALQKVEAIKAPEWAPFVKTGVHKERPPARNDWWHIRAASILRKIYRYGPIGVSKLRIKYGGKKNRGFKTEHTFRGSGNIIRKVLQQLEKAGFVKQTDVKGHKGRIVTAEGKKFLDGVATALAKNKPAPVKETPKAPAKESPKEKVPKEDQTQKASTEAEEASKKEVVAAPTE